MGAESISGLFMELQMRFAELFELIRAILFFRDLGIDFPF